MVIKVIKRILNHAMHHPWSVKRKLGPTGASQITEAVRKAEIGHSAEIRVVIEGALSPMEIIYGKTPRDRAAELFGLEKVWDTELNNGVLIYTLLGDRDVEILADRGINGLISSQEWEDICVMMQDAISHQGLVLGCIKGVESVAAKLRSAFPSDKVKNNQLVDEIKILR